MHLGDNETSKTFQKRAYKELLEFCAKKINHGRKPYKAIYTLDGQMLENMRDLVKFCEDSLSVNKKRVIIREPSIHERAEG